MNLLILAAGTGGHVYPALAVADMVRSEGGTVCWFGTRAGVESRLVPEAGIELHYAMVSGIRGKGLWRALAAPLQLLVSGLQTLAVMLRTRPSVVLGMGGYGAGPGGVAARMARVPLVIHEQNAVPGMTNRLLAPISTRVLEAFPGSFPSSRRAVHTGNPVRLEILSIEPRERPASGRVRLLVLGGSQGASFLNEVVPQALSRISGRVSLAVQHQAGPRHAAATVAYYRAADVDADVRAYIDDMAAAYQWADLVVCRAGAMTLAELGVVGVASVLVPFPHAVDDHQTRNARYFESHGAACVIAQRELGVEGLAALLVELVGDPARLDRMAQAARALGRPDATRQVVAQCREAAGG